MKQSTMEAYAEVHTILNLMDNNYVKEIPDKLRKMFQEKGNKEYTKDIKVEKPLEQQVSKEALAILAVLNYNYWCKDEKRKKELFRLYKENEEKYQEELREKYNPDNIFKKAKEKRIEPIKESKEEVQLVEYPKWYKRIFNRIMRLFRK